MRAVAIAAPLNFYAVGKWTGIMGLSTIGLWMRVPNMIQMLLTLMGLDILSGLIAAFANKSLNSSIMAKGLFRKLAVFPLLGLLHIVEQPLNISFELESIGAIAFIVYESMSIVENCANAGVPIPTIIVSAMAKAKVRTATAKEIHAEFAGTEETKMSVQKSTEVVKTPDSQPDLRVEKVITVLEETHTKVLPSEDSK